VDIVGVDSLGCLLLLTFPGMLWEYFDSCSTFFAFPIFLKKCCVQCSPLEIDYRLRRCLILIINLLFCFVLSFFLNLKFVVLNIVILIWVCLFCDGLLERLLLLSGSTSLEVLCCACSCNC
jgi:hypothetical protein